MPKYLVAVVEETRIVRTREFEAENEQEATELAEDDTPWSEWDEDTDQSSGSSFIEYVEEVD
jgi:hypothetical protein